MAPPPELNDDAVAEVLLRLPPDDPACLVRAAAVCKPWLRILSDPAFPRRYREFHQTPPMLGFLRIRYALDPRPRFVPAADASPFSSPEFDCYKWRALDCRHGRVLFRSVEPTGLIVWDPITGDKHYLPQPACEYLSLAAAVLCAAGGCDHLDCHGGPFLVVSVGVDIDEEVTRVSLYSSEIGAWSDIEACLDFSCDIAGTPCLLAGDALYFVDDLGLSLIKYDLGEQDLSVIATPKEYHLWMGTLMTAEGGGLGLTGMEGYNLHLWSWQASADVTGYWMHKVIEVELRPLPVGATSPTLIGFAEGSSTIFMNTYAGAYAVDLNSGKVRKIGKIGRYYSILPYMSFHTPDLAEARLLLS